MSFCTSLAFSAPTSASALTTLALPAGYVASLDWGRTYTIAGWVVAIGVSPSVFIVSRPRPQPPFPSPLLEQLVGFLVGRGAEVLRLDIRFPGAWHKRGNLEATARFWTKEFLSNGWRRRLFVALPANPSIPVLVPLAAAAENALSFWEETLLLMNALAAEFPESMVRIRPDLWEIARDWEQRWNAALGEAEKRSPLSSDEQPAVCAADRAWATVIREHLESCRYRMEAATVARLL